MQQNTAPRVSPLIVLTFGILAVSSGSILVRLAQGQDMPSLVIAAWRLLLSSAVLLPIALCKRWPEMRRISGRAWVLALVSGFMLALHFASWISSLAYTSVSASTVLVTTSPLWVGLTAPFLLNEPLSKAIKVGIPLAMLGSVFIGVADVVAIVDGHLQFSLAGFSKQSNPLLGNSLALFGALAASAYLLIGRHLRLGMSLLSYTALVYSTAAVFLVIFAVASGYNLFGYVPQTYLVVLAMALFPQLIGHSSYNWALGFLSAASVSLVVIAEPVGATFLAFLVFQEIPNAMTLAGSGLLLAGIVYASRSGSKKIKG